MVTINLNLALKELVEKVLEPELSMISLPWSCLIEQRWRADPQTQNYACLLRYQTEMDVWPAANRSNRILLADRENRERLQNAPTPTIHYPISHTQGTTRFTVCIKPRSVCHSQKSLGKQKNKIDEINKWNNPSHMVLERYIFIHESLKFITLSACSILHHHILSCSLLSCLCRVTVLGMHKTCVLVLMVSCLQSMLEVDGISIKNQWNM